MPVFVSYSHRDKDFVDELAAQLVRHKTHVWLDRWELKAGDSIIERIQSAIKTASALVVVLSEASVASEWCRKELSAGLIRELEERRVLILPVLLDDCDVPIFLKDKKYADFRTNYDEGLRATLAAIAAVTSDTQGRFEQPQFHTDWGIDWGFVDERYALRVTFVDHSERLPYSGLTEVRIVCNEVLTRKFGEYEQAGLGWFGRLLIVAQLDQAATDERIQNLVLEDSLPKIKTLHLVDPRTGFAFDVEISCRRLGTDTGMDTLVNWGNYIRILLEDLSKDISEGDRQNLRKVMSEGGTG